MEGCVFINSSKSEVKRTKKIGYRCGGTDPGMRNPRKNNAQGPEYRFRLDHDQGS